MTRNIIVDSKSIIDELGAYLITLRIELMTRIIVDDSRRIVDRL
jgi:hypothetical protein